MESEKGLAVKEEDGQKKDSLNKKKKQKKEVQESSNKKDKCQRKGKAKGNQIDDARFLQGGGNSCLPQEKEEDHSDNS